MKKIFGLYLLMPLIVFNFSCKKTTLTEFDINYSTTLTVPPSSYTVNTPANFTTPQVPTQSASKFSSEKTAESLISEIKLTKFNISTSAGTLDALKSIVISIQAPGLANAVVATKTGIPAGSTSVAADLNDVNIKDYIFKDNVQFNVSLTITADSLPSQQLKLDQTVHVKATLTK